MNTPSNRTDPSHHMRLADILDELADRLAAGETIELSDYEARCPECTEQLREAFSSLERMFRLRGQLSVVSEADDESLKEMWHAPLGDYRILREVGRGGMGVVYEAHQLSLNRRVAVKILPLASLLTVSQLRRFQSEARAAAMLRHSNIVNVHAVGCERGIHYYAMDLIDGHSMAELIQQMLASAHIRSPNKSEFVCSSSHTVGRLPTPDKAGLSYDNSRRGDRDTQPLAQLTTQCANNPREYYRSMARLGAILADALHFAHEQGVTHRDIKPSNLLIDSRGNPWITDFGLAQVQGDPGITMTGDRVGTLRYMSPEQAAGRKLMDHRTDIYSLGVTLYEAFALRPARIGSDREQLLRLLEESSIPLLRKVCPSVPRDLETIIAKATAQEAEDRYDSAADMANDLRRFLDLKPVVARRARHWLQILRWVQRHRAFTALLCSTALLLMLLAIVGPIVAWRYRQLAASESKAHTKAGEVQKELQLLLRDTLTTTATTLEDVPNVDPLQEHIIKQTLDQYDRLLQLTPHDDAVRFDLAKAYARLGRAVSFRMGGRPATPLILRAKAELAGLLERHPSDVDIHFELAGVRFVQSVIDWTPDEFDEAARVFRELTQRDPFNTQYRSGWSYSRAFQSHVLRDLGRIIDSERFANEAIELTRRSLEIEPGNTDRQFELAYSLHMLARLRTHSGNMASAAQLLEEAKEIYPSLQPSGTDNTRLWIAFTSMRLERALVAYYAWQPDLAEAEVTNCIKELETIVKAFPHNSWPRGVLIHAYLLVGDCYVAMRRDEEALIAYQHAIEHKEDLSRLGENTGKFGVGHLQRGLLLWRHQNEVDARREFRNAKTAIEQMQQRSQTRAGFALLADLLLRAPDPVLRDPRLALECARNALEPQDGQSFRRMGVACYQAGEFQQSIDALLQATERLNGGDARDCYLLAMAHCQLQLTRQADFWMRRGRERHKPPCLLNPIELEELRSCAESLLRQGSKHRLTADSDAATEVAHP